MEKLVPLKQIKNIETVKEVKLNLCEVTPRFCGACKYLNLTETDQDKQYKKMPHICKLYNERVKHNGYHPRLPVLEQCKYEG